MKQIIDGKLYDTEKAEELLKYSKNVGYPLTTRNDFVLFRTNKGAYFEFNASTYELNVITDADVKKYLGIYNPDKYIELFGEVEEA